MPVQDIKEIRIFPTLAIGRFGSSDQPMDNYDIVEGPDISSRRTLVPAETLRVVGNSIASAEVPTGALEFRDSSDLIRPVCPFVEVWARFEDNGPFRPLTKDDVNPAELTWNVRVANRKVQRRTRVAEDADLVTATVSISGADHSVQPLAGRATNFLPNRSIPLGEVQYLQPTDAFPEIRLRFRPGKGNVYGFEVNTFVTADRVVYDTGPGKGTWQNYDQSQDPLSPIPPDTYREGILDDSCDGIVEVSINGTNHSARGRISAGPPDFAPDSQHVSTAEDLLKQMMFGPGTTTPANQDERDQLVADVVDLMRRALETVRLMYTDRLNVTYSGTESDTPGGQPVGAYDPAIAANPNVVDRHTQVLQAVSGLKSTNSSTFNAAKQFLQLLLARHRPYTQTWDRQQTARQLMPAFMRGSDAGDLSITRRLIAQIEEAMRLDSAGPATPVGTDAMSVMRQMIVDLAPVAAAFHAGISLGGGETLTDLFADPNRLMQYLKDAKAKGAQAGTVLGQDLVKPQNPDGSAFFKLINGLNPAMSALIASYHAPGSGINGIEVVRNWINSLPVI